MATMLPYVADYDAKRRILEIACLNCTLDGASLVPEIRKPFDVVKLRLNRSSAEWAQQGVCQFWDRRGLVNGRSKAFASFGTGGVW
jgi:hypothetical protein